jgi:hypothetical protein
MKDRLAVHADERDSGGVDRICGEESAHRIDMRVGDRALEVLRRFPRARGIGSTRVSASLRTSATSMPSIEVPLMTPIAASAFIRRGRSAS